MKKQLWLVAGLLTACSGVLPAQDVTPTIVAGSKALLFSFGGLANLNANAFDGGIGGKYYLSGSWALRGGLQFSTANQSTPVTPPGLDGSTSAWTVGVSASLEHHLTTTRVSPFLGGGASISFTRTENKLPEPGGGAQTTVNNSRGGHTIGGQTYLAGTAIGVYGLAGVEYYLAEEVSLAAEYRLGFSTNAPPDEEVISGNTTTTTAVGSTTAVRIATGGVLTLAVYF